ncbi:hypothetical protein KY315_03035 [Candidatus Woesearchaeota archaeon]|nr:hypothetical protein [Candidatus Woesearchaeota archaeon]
MVNGTKEVNTKQSVITLVLNLQKPLKELMEEIITLMDTYEHAWQLSHAMTKILIGSKPKPVKLPDELIFAASAVRTLPNLVRDIDLQNLGTYLDAEFSCLESIRKLILELAQASNKRVIAAIKDDIKDLCRENLSSIKKVNSIATKMSAAF